jgi:hypothetical protein
MAALCLAVSSTAMAACPADRAGAAIDAATLRAWSADATAPSARFEQLAPELADCLASPDPQRRDALGFEVLSAWMRAGRLPPTTLRHLRDRWLLVLQEPDDADGFHAPFAALALSEVARADRVQPFLSDEERQALRDAGIAWLVRWRDYRAHDDVQGWRHGVAHGADLLMQLSIGPAMTPEGASRVLDALGSQVLAHGQLAYRHGEGERLARAARFALLRSGWSAAQVQGWLAELLAPAQGTGLDEHRLRLLHNARQFLWPLYVMLQEQPDASLRERCLGPVRQALARLD